MPVCLCDPHPLRMYRGALKPVGASRRGDVDRLVCLEAKFIELYSKCSDILILLDPK